MKTVKSRSDLNSMALKQGATVELGSDKFNTSRNKAAPRKRLEPNPEAKVVAPPPPPPPPPPTVDPTEGSKILADKLDEVSAAHIQMMGDLRQEISMIKGLPPSTAPRVLKWDFEIVRDNKGYLTKLQARATEQKPILD